MMWRDGYETGVKVGLLVAWLTIMAVSAISSCSDQTDVTVTCPVEKPPCDCSVYQHTIDSLEYELCVVRAFDTERRGQIQHFYNWFHEQGITVPPQCHGRNVDLKEECGR